MVGGVAWRQPEAMTAYHVCVPRMANRFLNKAINRK